MKTHSQRRPAVGSSLIELPLFMYAGCPLTSPPPTLFAGGRKRAIVRAGPVEIDEEVSCLRLDGARAGRHMCTMRGGEPS